MLSPAQNLADNWEFTELWVDPTASPPYVLILLSDKSGNSCVYDPAQNYQVVFQYGSVKDRQGFKSLANSESPLKRTTNSASNSRIHPTLSISTGIDSRADVVDTYPNSIG